MAVLSAVRQLSALAQARNPPGDQPVGAESSPPDAPRLVVFAATDRPLDNEPSLDEPSAEDPPAEDPVPLEPVSPVPSLLEPESEDSVPGEPLPDEPASDEPPVGCADPELDGSEPPPELPDPPGSAADPDPGTALVPPDGDAALAVGDAVVESDGWAPGAGPPTVAGGRVAAGSAGTPVTGSTGNAPSLNCVA